MNKNLTNLSDNELVEGGVLNDAECLGELYNRYFHKVQNQCLLFVKDKQTAFDLTQDIMLKGFLHLTAYQKKASFSSWLLTIARNHCKDYVRTIKLHHQTSFDGEKYQDLIESDEEQEQNVKLEEETLSLLEQLSTEDKELLIRKYVHETSIHDLQQIFHLSESAVKMRLNRAKKKLAVLFRKNHP